MGAVEKYYKINGQGRFLKEKKITKYYGQQKTKGDKQSAIQEKLFKIQ